MIKILIFLVSLLMSAYAAIPLMLMGWSLEAVMFYMVLATSIVYGAIKLSLRY